jgi:putative membrane protein
MKRASIAFAIAGLLLATGLIAYYGADTVLGSVLSVGWQGFAGYAAYQVILFIILGLAWRVVVPAPGLAGLPVFVWGRMVRDSGGNLLPFSQIGGFVLGARAVTLRGVSWPLAAASTTVDVTTEFLAQIAFALFGLAVLAARQPDSVLIVPVVIGTILAASGGIGFIAVQQGASSLFRRLGARIAGSWSWCHAAWLDGASVRVERMQEEFDRIYRCPGAVALGIGLHCGGWLATGVSSWIAYRLLGMDIDLLSALAIEALLSAALTFAFIVPGSAGVQEAAYAAIGAVFGMPPEISLGVSLLRRARDLVVGAPILLAWQFAEAQRLTPRRAQPAPQIARRPVSRRFNRRP